MTGAAPISRFIYDEHERLRGWLESVMPGHQLRDDARCIGHEKHDRLVAVCAFDTFARNDCMLTIASDGSRRWFSREFACVAMAFPFRQCGFSRVTSLVSERNLTSMVFQMRFGWTIEGRLRRAGVDGEDLFLLGMLREECRWIPPDTDGAGFEQVPAL